LEDNFKQLLKTFQEYLSRESFDTQILEGLQYRVEQELTEHIQKLLLKILMNLQEDPLIQEKLSCPFVLQYKMEYGALVVGAPQEYNENFVNLFVLGTDQWHVVFHSTEFDSTHSAKSNEFGILCVGQVKLKELESYNTRLTKIFMNSKKISSDDRSVTNKGGGHQKTPA
jgi:hypothetical protein